ncbi:MAG: protein kinase, partial [Planctomycetes bacterium]|nr:protein kinase [Planctomycetota bacterium]
MLRVRIISNIAVAKDFISVKKQNKYLQAYQQEIQINPKMNFIDWIRKHQILTPEQIETLRKNYLSSWLQCKRCEHKFQVKDTDYQKPLICPNCGSEALEILTKREGKLVKDNAHQKGTEVLDIFETEALLVSEDRNDTDVLFPNDIINKNLQIVEKVGQGGMGAVYKAKHLNLNVPRAVKVLHQNLTKEKEQELRFIREARSAAALDHQNIVKVHNVDNDRDRLFIEMEWVEGDSIQDKIKNKGRLTIEESIDYIIQAAKGLYAAHRKGIIHRDIKPDNLMITDENVVKIADFGLAKASDASMDMQISQSGTILGTPYYMSPEQAQNQELKFSTDIYSLGVTFYHMLTGEVPYVGESAIQVLFQHIKSPFPSIRKKLHDIPQEIDHLILRMTAKNPQMRPQSMLEITEELESIREKYDFVPIRFTDFRAYSGKRKKSKTVMHREKKKKSPMILFMLFAMIFLFAGIGALWWEFGNLREIYDKYLKTYFNDDSLLPKDKEAKPEDSTKDIEIKSEDETKIKETPEQIVPTEEQLKIKRNKISGRKFRSLRDEFSGKNFSKYIRKLEEFRTEYADTTVITDVDEEIRIVKKNREIAANSWWVSKREQYLTSVT